VIQFYRPVLILRLASLPAHDVGAVESITLRSPIQQDPKPATGARVPSRAWLI
jgi:hypothetical protein